MVFSGCGGNSGSKNQTEDKTAESTTSGGSENKTTESVKITFSAPEESYPKDLLDQLAKVYMDKNPGVTIETESFAGVPQIEYYKAKLATGDLPDVFFMNTLDSAFVDAGAYMELPQDIVDAAPSTEYNAYKGKYYQVMNNQQIAGMFYNKQMFEERGLNEPKTQDELMAICDKFVADGITPIVIGFKDAWVGDFFLHGFMLTTDVVFKNPDWEIQRLKGEVKYNSPEVIKVYEKFIDWRDKGYFGKGFMGLTYQQCEEMFATGKAAMFPMGNWFIGDLANLESDVDVGWFPFPTEDGSPGYLKALGNSFSVNANTEHPEEVLAFYKWLTTDPEAVRITCERMSLIPDIKAAVEMNMDPLLQEIINKVQGMDGYIWTYAQWGDNAPPPGAYDYCVKISQDIAAGADIASSLQNFDEEYDKLQAARK